MDITTVVGLISGVMLVLVAIFMGGGLSMFLKLDAAMITVGGTVAATMMSFSLSDMAGLIKVLMKAFLHKGSNIPDIITMMLRFALKARREGILSLESEIDESDDEFLTKSLQIAIDGTSPEVMEDMLNTELSYLEKRHQQGQNILKTMGSLAPAFGLIGTLIGLIQMLSKIDDPSSVGPGMAVALLTTFYGALAANLVFIPLAGKLGLYSQAETTAMEMIVEGVCAIAGGENPTAIREKMQAFVSQSKREEVKANI